MVKSTSSDRSDALMVRSVEKAFRIIDAFDSERAYLSLSEISARTGLDMSATQRFVHTLTRLGYLSKDSSSRHLCLTVKALAMGYDYLRANPLIERSMPFLQHISKETEETVNLTVPDGNEIVYVARFMSRHVINNDVVIGKRLPMYCTAPGIAMMACMRDSAVDKILETTIYQSFTPQTICDKDKIKESINLARERGYASSFEQIYHLDASIAAAIVNIEGRPIGALNIGTSLARFEATEIIEKFSPLVVTAARSINRK